MLVTAQERDTDHEHDGSEKGEELKRTSFYLTRYRSPEYQRKVNVGRHTINPYVLLGKQCAAVRTHRLPINEPPQKRLCCATATPRNEFVTRVPVCSGRRDLLVVTIIVVCGPSTPDRSRVFLTLPYFL